MRILILWLLNSLEILYYCINLGLSQCRGNLIPTIITVVSSPLITIREHTSSSSVCHTFTEAPCLIRMRLAETGDKRVLIILNDVELSRILSTAEIGIL